LDQDKIWRDSSLTNYASIIAVQSIFDTGSYVQDGGDDVILRQPAAGCRIPLARRARVTSVPDSWYIRTCFFKFIGESRTVSLLSLLA